MTTGYRFKRFIIDIARALGLISILNRISNFRFWIIKKYCTLTGKNPLEHVYNDAFFNVEDHAYALKDSPRVFADLLKRTYNPRSVVDIGCGCGFYLRELEKLGVEILGIDGSPAAARNVVIDTKKVIIQDATRPFSLPKRYDCVICFEVAEHIPTETSPVLVENLTRASDLVFMTAAQKGQGGHDHINEQNPQFWINLFEARGYSLLKEETEKMKHALSVHSGPFWLKDNLLIFKKQ